MTHLKKGDLIIADPSIVNDIQFNRSIILITSSSIENEVVGLIINKILDYKLKDIIPEINIDFDVYDGGPVNKDNLYYIHNLGHLIPESIKINQQLFWSGDFDTIVDFLFPIENKNLENSKQGFGYKTSACGPRHHVCLVARVCLELGGSL